MQQVNISLDLMFAGDVSLDRLIGVIQGVMSHEGANKVKMDICKKEAGPARSVGLKDEIRVYIDHNKLDWEVAPLESFLNGHRLDVGTRKRILYCLSNNGQFVGTLPVGGLYRLERID